MARWSSPLRARTICCMACSLNLFRKWKRGCLVTVAELQVLFSDLGKFLRSSGAAGVGGELEFIGSKLTPFRDYKLKAFAEFLEKAEAYSRGALAPKTKSSGPKKPK